MRAAALRLCFVPPLPTALLALVALAVAAGAAPTDPVSVSLPPEGQGDVFVPGIRLVEDLPEAYVEEEFLVSGSANLYNYANDPPAGPTDIAPVANAPYTTRIIVRRPAQHQRFNGSVVVEWWNSTAGFDSAPVWDVSAEYFAREGFIYVGVTSATNAIDFLAGGCSVFGVLPPTCGTRYTALSLPENGLAYEMLSQIANLLVGSDPGNPIPGDYRVERLYHSGQSQQGGSIVTYASAFHLPGVNDGYFVQANVFARTINSGPACGAQGAPPFPDCTPSLQGSDVFVRTDLPVPVVQALGETDVDVLFGIGGRQPETSTFRYYELAGVAHLTVHQGIEILPAGLLGPDPLFLEDLCGNPINSSADGPIVGSYLYNAMWDNLEQQVRRGKAPPSGRVMEVDGLGAVERDAFGNALGGVRVPEMDVPRASYNPPTNEADPNLPPFLVGIGNLACFLGGSFTPFDAATLDELYPNHGSYVSQVVHAANALRKDGFLLNEDRQAIVTAAAQSPIGCGLGAELVLLLPPLLWWRARRRVRWRPHGAYTRPRAGDGGDKVC